MLNRRLLPVLLVAALAYAAGDEEKSDEKGACRAVFLGASRASVAELRRAPTALVRARGV
jgi:uncharacterized membrane protein